MQNEKTKAFLSQPRKNNDIFFVGKKLKFSLKLVCRFSCYNSKLDKPKVNFEVRRRKNRTESEIASCILIDQKHYFYSHSQKT